MKHRNRVIANIPYTACVKPKQFGLLGRLYGKVRVLCWARLIFPRINGPKCKVVTFYWSEDYFKSFLVLEQPVRVER